MSDGSFNLPIYLDGHATTPLAPEAEDAMSPWWHRNAANPNSPHRRGIAAAASVEEARANLATLFGASPQEFVFTSGATESNNIAILGVAAAAEAAHDPRRELIISAIEHKSVFSAAKSLKARGFSIHVCPVRRDGLIDVSTFEQMLSERTLLVSVMAANNEIGTVQPIAALLPIIRTVGAMIHVDAAQIAGKLPVEFADYDYASVSSHKLYGPMGIGALFVSAAAQYRPRPLFYGGGQEAGLRPGTLPTPLIAGFGAAAKLAVGRLGQDEVHCRTLADRLVAGLEAHQVRFRRNVENLNQLPGSLSLGFDGIDSASFVNVISNDVCISEGSACSSGQIQPSYVLSSIGLSKSEIDETVRIYCGRYNSIAEIDYAVNAIAEACKK
ncbi:cysteine desulfurase family protein [Rhizobium sp. G21]|uniref:cysteine desulfurase family protein n=1 Tax=Rhizobium sp. G21 TaxID=2758439 RepID=UPI0016034709|nr:cysteine desulfurase family protein [Rhizobium sp. G21]MBB1249147.1 cysteine desulfurase [Rhizobium sp. G21]